MTGNLAWKKMFENGILCKLAWKEELGQGYHFSEGKVKVGGSKVAGGADREPQHRLLG